MRYVVPALCLLVSLTSELSAQSINITSPTATVSTYEGDDYASHVLGNSWDGNQRRDIGWEENLVGSGPTGVRVEDGKIKATYSRENGYFFPLFQGFTSSIFAEGLPGDRSLPRFGRNNPVDTSKYRYLSYRMYVSQHSVASVSWSKTTQTVGGGWPAERATYFDGYYTNSQGWARNGWYTYLWDMTDVATTFGSQLTNGTWSGNLISLRIEPSSYGTAGTQLEVDWVRLVDPNSAPQLNITWNSSSVDNIPDRVVTLAYTTNPADRSAGAPIAQFAKVDPKSFQFPLAALPPGEYYFFLYVHPANNMNSVITQSGLSAKVTILPAPSGYFTSPTQLSGEDYATTVLGNPWDMDAIEDVANLRFDVWPDIWRQFSNYDFSNGSFNATADAPLPGNPHSDVQVHLPVDYRKPIDTNKYRYLTYKIQVDESNHPTIAEKVIDGWVMRAVGFNHSASNAAQATNSFLPAAHVVYEGDHVYTYDLWDESAEAIDLGVTWKTNPWMYHLRVDPLEVIIPTRFSLDYVMLTAEPRPGANGIFPVSFVLEGSQNSNVSLYYDNDKLGFDGTLIASQSALAPGNHTINWDTSSLPGGNRYYLYLVVQNGSSVRRFYSPVPVAVGTYTDPVPPEVTPDPPYATPTPAPRVSDTPVFASVSVAPKVARKGGAVNFQASFSSGSPTRVDVVLSIGKRSLKIRLRRQADGSYGTTWRSRTLTSSSRNSFRVSYQATPQSGPVVKTSGGSLTVAR